MTVIDDVIAKEANLESKSRYMQFMDEQEWIGGILAPNLAFHHPTIGTNATAHDTTAAITARMSGVRTMNRSRFGGTIEKATEFP